MGAEFNKKFKIKPVIVTGFPYAFPYYFKVFYFLDNKNDYIFILPKFWSTKKGKVQFLLNPEPDFEIHGLKSLSYGGKSLLGGLFKGWMPGIAFELIKLKFKYGSQVLYSCSEPNLLTTLYNGFFAKLFGYKHILFTWQNIAPEKRLAGLKLKLSNALVKLNLCLANGIICGNKEAEAIIRRFNQKIRTVVCPISGVDIDKFRPGIGSDWRSKISAPGEKILLFYGAIEKRKGLEFLIKAFKIIAGKIACRLIIVGTGDQKQKLVDLADNLGLDEKIVFFDWMKNYELPALINAVDIFVYPSIPYGGWEEQFGYAMAEASACGLPVVSTRTGSIDEVVSGDRSGILVEPNDSKQLAEAFIKLLSDDNLRKRMGEYGRKYILANYSHQVIAKKITAFLSSFIK